MSYSQIMAAQPESSGIIHTSTTSENVASSSSRTLDNDAITSLRDAALKTLRSKRKRTVNDTTSLPVRPLPSRAAATPISVFLDYGSEEQPSADLTHLRRASSSKTVSDDAREEGEISDEEDTNESTIVLAEDDRGHTQGIPIALFYNLSGPHEFFQILYHLRYLMK